MNKELITKLIEKAKISADNAYCPFTNCPIGCSLLCEENYIFGGCNIETADPSCSVSAGEVAIFKAISEGYSKFRAVCFYSENRMPYPNGKAAQLLNEHNSLINIIVANNSTYSLHALYELFPFLPEGPEIE